MKVEPAVQNTMSSPSPKLILTHKQVHIDISPRQQMPFTEQQLEQSEDEIMYEEEQPE
jgi:hypothetical protein